MKPLQIKFGKIFYDKVYATKSLYLNYDNQFPLISQSATSQITRTHKIRKKS